MWDFLMVYRGKYNRGVTFSFKVDIHWGKTVHPEGPPQVDGSTCCTTVYKMCLFAMTDDAPHKPRLSYKCLNEEFDTYSRKLRNN